MLLIRPAAPEDKINIAEFQILMALETENLALDRETVLKGVSAVFQHPDLGHYRVACINEQVVASLLITYEWSDWRNARVWWIQSVYVVPAFRKQGIFNALYSDVQNDVNHNDHVAGIRLYVDRTNTAAQEVYHHSGMNSEHYQLFEWMK